uniref:Uncharacterized protein n=1 Tax=Noctiluca scintillans TaxID=2966 RepID=A0A7S1FD25_NOCSC
MYDKMDCWCQTNKKEKSKALEDADTQTKDLSNAIEGSVAELARLGVEIQNVETELEQNTHSLAEAEAIRKKQAEEFHREEKELIESITALDAALVVLSKHHGGFLQVPRSLLFSVVFTLRHELQTHTSLLQGVLSRTQRDAISRFVQDPDNSTHMPEYAPQSGEIYGILKQMSATFTKNLFDSRVQEAANLKNFEELKKAKQDEMQASQAQLEAKKTASANMNMTLANDRENLEDVNNQLSADQAFLADLNGKCSMTDKEWEERHKARHEELDAVTKAISILSADAAHETLTRTFNPTFLQEHATARLDRQDQAVAFLRLEAKRLHSHRLANVSTIVHSDSLQKVADMIGDMVTELKNQQTDEVAHRDSCIQLLHESELESGAKSQTKEDLQAQVANVKVFISERKSEVDALTAEIWELQAQMKTAGANTQTQHKAFQKTLADQQATQRLLQEAIVVLNRVYSFAQKQEPSAPAPEGFQTYKKNSGSAGAVALLEQIKADAKSMEVQTAKDMADAQMAYEEFVKDTNAAVSMKSESIVDKNQQIAEAQMELAEVEEQLKYTEIGILQLVSANRDLHTSCDFTLNNFDQSQASRAQEIEALGQAKAILLGGTYQ